MRLPFCCSLAILKNTLPLHQIKVPPLEMIAELMAALWKVFYYVRAKSVIIHWLFVFIWNARL